MVWLDAFRLVGHFTKLVGGFADFVGDSTAFVGRFDSLVARFPVGWTPHGIGWILHWVRWKPLYWLDASQPALLERRYKLTYNGRIRNRVDC
ncbi:hypothetical protein [Sporosarcina psychrophila]|uniref:hypothetical protein n=1 Tax=Sporosarcina psychrophila TaxID=1476 RepID=UPI00078C6F64|nr:hypothetical protein [Sporosarcina psychrophila]AMQ07718.1 hypothetical protein AZE41_18215 [Sporosarcina psychrophila]